jgi:hypothetical protein
MKRIFSDNFLSFFVNFLITYIVISLVCVTGCVSARKEKPLTSIQQQKKWEKDKLLQILSQEQVKRKDIAFLLVYYLNDLVPFFEKQPDFYHVGDKWNIDIVELEEKVYIVKALDMGWMTNFPDGKFYPEDEVKRFQFAIILFRVSKTQPILSDKSTSNYQIKDVPYSDYSYNAVTFTVSNGFLKLENNYFYKNRNVTGFKVATSLSKLRKMLIK